MYSFFYTFLFPFQVVILIYQVTLNENEKLKLNKKFVLFYFSYLFV